MAKEEISNGEFRKLIELFGSAIENNEIKHRAGHRTASGQADYPYLEWHLIADKLDVLAPEWSHAVRNITQVGAFVAVTASITIAGVTREGIGTGEADSEKGIKKAEHDALKRAAIKFNLGRALYVKEFAQSGADRAERPPEEKPRNPLSETTANLVTPGQLAGLRQRAKAASIDLEIVVQAIFKEHAGIKSHDLTKQAASYVIQTIDRKEWPPANEQAGQSEPKPAAAAAAAGTDAGQEAGAARVTDQQLDAISSIGARLQEGLHWTPENISREFFSEYTVNDARELNAFQAGNIIKAMSKALSEKRKAK